MAYRKAAPNGGSSNATREIAALDFLLNIPLEAEQEIVRSGLEAERKSGLTFGGDSYRHDRSHSIDDDEEKVELDLLKHLNYENNQNTKVTGGDGSTWWKPMVEKNKEFFAAEEERTKMREQLELETGILEAPDGSEALSALEEGKLKLQQFPDDTNKSLVAVPFPRESMYGERTTFAPGRRLDGFEATLVKIPVEEAQTELKTTMRTVVRKAAVREWERKMVSSPPATSNRGNQDNQCLLDGRIFFSGMSSYPMSVFSVIKYEPKKEEENRRRKYIEALGGGGSSFIMPSRDWRGISYRALLPRFEKKNKEFNQIIKRGRKIALQKRKQRVKRIKSKKRREQLKKKREEEKESSTISSNLSDESNTMSKSGESGDDVSFFGDDDESGNSSGMESDELGNEMISDEFSSSSEESTSYYPGFLDDPEMTKGRHRHVMVGDRVTGCVVSSTIHFVSPADLKADLNKQFRERFDQWEPPKPQQKYIGARVIEGCYTLLDQTEFNTQDDNDQRNSDDEGNHGRRRRKGSISEQIESIRMPPSLTLSKIRNIKQQALLACIDSNIEVSTVALACVYFERLALDCRVDKSNRRLTFAACLLIAIKINEANVALVTETPSKNTKKSVGVIKSWIKTNKGGDVFASILEFFTHDWGLSLKTLFAAEFGVFAALNFKLHATPSQVAFHFKRMMKILDWSPIDYLGKSMYEQWQECLVDEKIRKDAKEQRLEQRQQRSEKKLLQLQHKLKMIEEAHGNQHQQAIYDRVINDSDEDLSKQSLPNANQRTSKISLKKKPGLKIFNRIGLKKSSNNLVTLVSPSKNSIDGGNDGVKNSKFASTIGVQDNTVKRSVSTPNFS